MERFHQSTTSITAGDQENIYGNSWLLRLTFINLLFYLYTAKTFMSPLLKSSSELQFKTKGSGHRKFEKSMNSS
ncbi:hypothetical protein scyTo_0004232 [Scyliorhinus torazame]|uniref:Uncharacterized protein n=1 Tax=Scyliorhinus torazame TaxID=75743 RepID=A0A401NN68_SCYTO|nr:hypothetical protein [Scyliorhinus torazame]